MTAQNLDTKIAQIADEVAANATEQLVAKPKLSTAKKVGIGAAAVAVIGGAGYFAARRFGFSIAPKQATEAAETAVETVAGLFRR